MKTAFYLAQRLQKSKKKHPLVRLISFFSNVGIAIGVMVLIIGLSAMNGFERELNNRILGVVPHVELTAKDTNHQSIPIFNYQEIINKLDHDPNIIANAPFVVLNGLLEKSNKLKLAQIRGIDPNKNEQLGNLHHFIGKEHWQQFKKQQGIILGSILAHNLNVNIGDSITILLSQANNNHQLSKPKRVNIKVIGMLKIGGILDSTTAFIHLDQAQKLAGFLTNEVSGIDIKVKDPFNTQNLSFNTIQDVRQNLFFNTWISKFGYMYNDIKMIRLIMYVTMALVILVASFNIISTLIMTVKDKQGEIAILSTMGAKESFITRVFVFLGVILSLKGALFGTILGVGISFYLTEIIKFIELLLGHNLLSGDIYFVNFIPTEVKITDIILTIVLTILLTLIASFYPAKRAAKLDPAQVLSKY